MRLPTWAAIIYTATAARPHDDVSTAACLADPTARCIINKPCSRSTAGFTRECLDTWVPFRTAHDRVTCCMDCCLQHFVRKYGLDANARRAAVSVPELSSMVEAAKPSLLMAHNHEGTLPYASRRLTKRQNAWLQKHSEAAKALGPELNLRCRGATCDADDRKDTVARLWSERRTGTPGKNASGQALDPGHVGAFAPGWVEMHFGDGCGAYNHNSPFGAYREITLAALWRAARLGTGNARIALVTSSDCDLPDAHAAKRRHHHHGFVDERSLLEAPGVATWFATNPNDHLLGAHPKLKAVPLGVAHRGKWAGLLDGREARNRTNRLACCCLSSHPTPSRANEPGASKPHNSFATLTVELRGEFEDARKMLSPEGLAFKYAKAGWVGSVYGRIRRYAVVEALKRNGFGHCSHRGPPGTTRRADQRTPLDAFAAHLLESDFTVSPQGIGRACHREWEALSAGAIPLVDWDASPAMAELYGGLPVVRVKDWRDVTPAFLEDELRSVLGAGRSMDMKKLYLPYWVARFTDHVNGIS